MTQLVMTITIGDGRVVATEFSHELERYATARDRLEAHRLEMIFKARVQAYARKQNKEEKK